ncbi:D-hexose-6-phosphate mutarotase [Acidipila sp. EB88]|uniref:D-hexose-6-phosphate mutarotase n=1 Tax=Acidipila sp. EB88 TaxID=2305226 RepID=UPI000F60449B|nr:D-hexose-6-phosphate mutarotase [Acidipila sp. EB88]RRA47221.1 D-hexose-6-phosphate mutarotase [Acidipila sp. EB88]
MTTPAQLDLLNQRFGIDHVAHVAAGHGGLPVLSITTPAASAQISLHGAQVLSWQPGTSGEVLFLSQHSRWEDGKAIRGGIPVCFPWFRAKTDDPKAPAHGFARTRSWTLAALEQTGEGVQATLTLESDESSRQWWPHAFALTYRITIGAALHLALTVTNTDNAAWQFEEALHTYNKVSDVRTVRVQALDGAAFLDNMDGNKIKQQSGELQLQRSADNAYLDTHAAPEIVDPAAARRILLEKQNSATTIVWNPWSDGAAALADLGDEEWSQFLCVEAGNILSDKVTVQPGAEHTLQARLSVTPTS